MTAKRLFWVPGQAYVRRTHDKQRRERDPDTRRMVPAEISNHRPDRHTPRRLPPFHPPVDDNVIVVVEVYYDSPRGDEFWNWAYDTRVDPGQMYTVCKILTPDGHVEPAVTLRWGEWDKA